MSTSKNSLNIDDKIFNKLEKLYRLAVGAKEVNSLGEAQTALLKFREIIAKHKLDIDEKYFENYLNKSDNNSSDKSVYSEPLIQFKKRRTFWKIELATILANNFRCKIYLSYYPTGSIVEYMSTVMIVGEREDIDIVKYLYSSFEVIAQRFVESYIDRFKSTVQDEFNRHLDTKTRAKIKNDYLSGFIKGLSDALNEQNHENKEVALVLTTPKSVEDTYNAIVHPERDLTVKPPKSNLSKGTTRMRLFNPKIYKDGYDEGYDVGNNKDRRLNGE